MSVTLPVGTIKRISEVTCCDGCKTSEVKETRKWNQHTNGHWNESIKFACGRSFSFSPNFMCVQEDSPCQWDAAFKARKEKVQEVKAAIFDMATENGLHLDDMKRLKSSLEYWNVAY